jgi:glycosyltransferase involved in cell wall biosynthesis
MNLNVALMASSGAGSGGGQRSVRLLAKLLAHEGVKVTVISYEKDVDLEWPADVNVIERNVSKIQQHAQPLTLAKVVMNDMFSLEKKGIDVFHIYNFGCIAGSGLYKLFGGQSKVVATLNSYSGICPTGDYLCCNIRLCSIAHRIKCLGKNQRMMMKLLSVPCSILFPYVMNLSRSLDAYIAMSNSVKEIYSEAGFDVNRMVVIPAAYEEGYFKCEREYGNTFRVLYVGSLSENKGVGTLITAFAHMAKKRPDCKLTVIGDGALKKDLVRMVMDLNICDKVELLGRMAHNDIFVYYKKAHIFVHPGIWHEPFGRTLLESMSVGLPCVVSNTGAPPEIIGDAGLTFHAGDSNDLRNKLMLLYDNRELLSELSVKCEDVVNKYDPKSFVEKTISFYQDVSEVNKKDNSIT